MALQLYQLNTKLSEALYGLLQSLEVILRNAFHEQLSVALSTTWYDTQYGSRSLLRPKEAESVRHAKDRILGLNNSIVPGQVVASLSFGFWVNLTSGDYEQSLWMRMKLYEAFPRRPRHKFGRVDIYKRLNDLRRLRNRVAHHEPIFNLKLRNELGKILETIDWISIDAAAWVAKTNGLEKLLDDNKL